MSGYLLDTNIPSEMLRSRPDASVASWLQRQANDTLFVSVVTMGELRRGITLLTERSPRRAELDRMIGEKVPSWFDGERQLAGRPLNIADGMIAATALEHGLTLVTRNVKDFADLGLILLNPWDTA
jgi:predicted nucleic acid-binding protein